MRRITTPTVITSDMINLRNIFPVPARNWLNRPSVKQSMGQRISTLIPNLTVPVGVKSSSPFPAFSFFINSNLRKDASKFAAVQMFNYEILLIIHVRGLLFRLRMWLEPLGCLSHSGGLPIIT